MTGYQGDKCELCTEGYHLSGNNLLEECVGKLFHFCLTLKEGIFAKIDLQSVLATPMAPMEIWHVMHPDNVLVLKDTQARSANNVSLASMAFHLVEV